MRAENLSVAAAFDLSYRDLTAGQQRLFRRLGVHPGTDIDGYAAAALDGTDLAAARRNLEGLYDHYLLAEHARGRYRLHDLLAEHARALAAADDPADADAAAGRLLDYYLHTAAAAGRHIATRNIAAARPPPGEPPAVAPLLPTASRASAWLDAERANLDAAAGYAAASGRPGHVIAIPAAISGFLYARGHWDQSAALHRTALAAAGRAGDRPGQAGALNELGILHRATGDFPAAAASHRQALALYRGLGRPARPGQRPEQSGPGGVGDRGLPGRSRQPNPGARAVPGPRSTRPARPAPPESRQRAARTGDYPAAAASQRQALAIFRDIGDRLGQALATGNLGILQGQTGDYPAATPACGGRWACTATWATGRRGPGHRDLGDVQRLTGDYPAAADSLPQALDIFRDLGDRRWQALATGNLGIVQAQTGDYPAAAASLIQALGMYDELGDRWGQARVLNYLGEMLSRSGDGQQARDHHARALALAREISSPRQEARALEGIGQCLLQDGDPGEGAAHWRQALAIYERIGAPDAGRIRETLRRHSITTTPGSRARRPPGRSGTRTAPDRRGS